MQPNRLDLADIHLINGEYVDSTFSQAHGKPNDSSFNKNVILLTNHRVIHINTNGPKYKTRCLFISDIDEVEVKVYNHRGYSPLVWGVIGLFVAVAVWKLWSSPWWSSLSALAIAFMGSYLVVDYLKPQTSIRIEFRADSSQILFSTKNCQYFERIYALATRFHKLRAEANNDGTNLSEQ